MISMFPWYAMFLTTVYIFTMNLVTHTNMDRSMSAKLAPQRRNPSWLLRL